MENGSLINVVAVAFFSGLFGGVMGAVANHLLSSKKRQVEIRNLEADTRNLDKQTERLDAQATEMRDRQDKVEFLIKHFLPGPQLYFLERFKEEKETKKPIEFKDKFRDKEHLRQIRDAGFIENIVDKNIGDLKHGENLKQFFQISDKGSEYLRWVAELGG
jgi:hypothetical protein